jgi:cell division protease FtsH
MEAMTKALLEWETIDADQIDDIMSGKPPREPKPSQSNKPTEPPKDDAPVVPVVDQPAENV